MNARVPASAPTTPPDTGASMLRCPAASASACAARASSTAIVDDSMNSVPGRAAASSSPRYASITCRPAGNIVITISASATASAPLAATGIPAAVAASTAAGTGS